MTRPGLIGLIVRGRQGVVWQGQVKAISANNVKGNFDVLPNHANFISVLKNRLVLHLTDGSKHEIALDNGVMKASLNNVEVFVGVV